MCEVSCMLITSKSCLILWSRTGPPNAPLSMDCLAENAGSGCHFLLRGLNHLRISPAPTRQVLYHTAFQERRVNTANLGKAILHSPEEFEEVQEAPWSKNINIKFFWFCFPTGTWSKLPAWPLHIKRITLPTAFATTTLWSTFSDRCFMQHRLAMVASADRVFIGMTW